MEVSPNYDSPLDTSGEEEAGGDKPEQEELWGRMEEQGRSGIFGAFKLFIFKQTLVSRGMAGLP